jgi:SsrA-binding protein
MQRTRSADMAKDNAGKLIANNKKAYYDYFIEDKYEAGLVLCGTEVKSMRLGKCSIKEAYVQVINGEVYIIGMNITPYEKGNIFNKDPLRPKKLLLHKSEINKLMAGMSQQGYAIVPLQVYLKKGRMKIEIGLAKGKKNYDKRDSIAKKDQQREAQKEFKIRNLT